MERVLEKRQGEKLRQLRRVGKQTLLWRQKADLMLKLCAIWGTRLVG